MATMNISLPETMREFIEQEVAEEGYHTASEYFRDLIRERQRRKEAQQLETRLIESLSSGEPTEVTPEFWDKMKTRFAARHGRIPGDIRS